jgi:hypothetical protein
MFKEIKDERLQLQKYKAGYETFKILTAMNFLVAIILIYIFDKQNSIINILLIPCFAGMWIYEFKAQEAIDFEEGNDANKVVGPNQWFIILRQMLLFGLGIFIFNYFLEPEKTVWQTAKYSLIAAMIMGILWYLRMRHVFKKSKEEEENV